MIGLFGSIDNIVSFNELKTNAKKRNFTIEENQNEDFQIGVIHKSILKRKILISKIRDRYTVSISGEIFTSKCDNQIDDEIELLINHFDTEGIDGLRKINGQFTSFIYDHLEKTAYLISDKYGTKPQYYSNVNGLLFSTDIKSINYNAEINFDAVSELFHFKQLLGNHTLLQNIQMLPPASVLRYKNKKIDIIKYWDFPFNERVYFEKCTNKHTLDNLYQEFNNIFINSVKRQIKNNSEKILLPLSGGLDSRWVAGIINKLGHTNLKTFTLGESTSEDVVYGKQVADKLGFEHNIFQVNPKIVWEDAKIFSELNNHMFVINGPLQIFEALRSYKNQSEILLTPQMSDALFGSTLIRPDLKRLFGLRKHTDASKNILTNHFQRISSEILQSLFSKEYYEKIRSRKNNTLEHYIDNYKIPLHSYFNFLLNEYVRRGTFSGNFVTNLFFETRMPSYDDDFINFGYNLPLNLRIGQKFYRESFNKLFPELASIPRDKTNLPINSNNTRVAIRTIENAVVKKMKNTKLNFLVKSVKRWNNPNYVDYKLWFKYDFQTSLAQLIDNSVVMEQNIFNRDYVNKILYDHFKTNKDYSDIFWQIINLEYFYKNIVK